MAEIIRGVQMFGKLLRAVKQVLLKWIARGISRNDCVLGVRSLGKNSSRRWALREHLKGLGRSHVSKDMGRNRKCGELDKPFMPRGHDWRKVTAGITKWKDLIWGTSLLFKKLYFEIIIDSHAVVRNNPEISYTPYPTSGSFYFFICSDISSLLDIWFANTSAQSVTCFIHLQKVDEIQFIVFSLYWLCFLYQV